MFDVTQGLDARPFQRPSAAASFLEALQARVYGSMGLTAEDCQWREWLGQQNVIPLRLQQMSLALPRPEFEEYRRDLLAGLARDEAAPRPTRFERPHQYSILRELQKEMEHAAEVLGLQVPVRPLMGTLPTQLLEPLMLLVPGSDDVVVVIDGNLLTYAHQLAKAVAQALPLGLAGSGAGEPEFRSAAMGRDVPGKAVKRFNELMMAVVTGNPAIARPYLPEPAYETIACELCDCMELFIVAREYARLVDGDHLKASTEARAACGERFQALCWTTEQETRADGLGLALTLTAAAERGDSLSWAFFAIDALLASFGILERSLPILTRPADAPLFPDLGAAHDTRRGLVRDVLRHWDGGQHVIAFADGLVPVVAQLGDQFEAALYDLRWWPQTVN